MKKIKKVDWFLLYLTVILGIAFLRFFGRYPPGLIKFFDSFVTLSKEIVTYFGLNEIAVFLQNIPMRVLFFLIGGVQIMMGFFDIGIVW